MGAKALGVWVGAWDLELGFECMYVVWLGRWGGSLASCISCMHASSRSFFYRWRFRLILRVLHVAD